MADVSERVTRREETDQKFVGKENSLAEIRNMVAGLCHDRGRDPHDPNG